MTNRAPSDKADKIIIRLPDGMRDRLHARAKANDRTLTAEVVQMLEQALDETSNARIEELTQLQRQLEAEEDATTKALAAIHDRKEAITEELMRRQMVKRLRDNDDASH